MVTVIDRDFVNWDKAKNKYNQDRTKTRCVLGIHTGWTSDGYNIGTLITPEIGKWRDEVLRAYDAKYRMANSDYPHYVDPTTQSN